MFYKVGNIVRIKPNLQKALETKKEYRSRLVEISEVMKSRVQYRIHEDLGEHIWTETDIVNENVPSQTKVWHFKRGHFCMEVPREQRDKFYRFCMVNHIIWPDGEQCTPENCRITEEEWKQGAIVFMMHVEGLNWGFKQDVRKERTKTVMVTFDFYNEQKKKFPLELDRMERKLKKFVKIEKRKQRKAAKKLQEEAASQ